MANTMKYLARINLIVRFPFGIGVIRMQTNHPRREQQDGEERPNHGYRIIFS
jgi:hypothetical protein